MSLVCWGQQVSLVGGREARIRAIPKKGVSFGRETVLKDRTSWGFKKIGRLKKVPRHYKVVLRRR